MPACSLRSTCGGGAAGDFTLKMMNFVLNMMDFTLKMMNFVLNMMDFVLKMMNFVFQALPLHDLHRTDTSTPSP